MNLTFDNQQFVESPKHPIKPLCAFCDSPIYILSMQNDWLWFIYKESIHYAHSECMQQNVSEEAPDESSQWQFNEE